MARAIAKAVRMVVLWCPLSNLMCPACGGRHKSVVRDASGHGSHEAWRPPCRVIASIERGAKPRRVLAHGKKWDQSNQWDQSNPEHQSHEGTLPLVGKNGRSDFSFQQTADLHQIIHLFTTGSTKTNEKVRSHTNYSAAPCGYHPHSQNDSPERWSEQRHNGHISSSSNSLKSFFV